MSGNDPRIETQFFRHNIAEREPTPTPEGGTRRRRSLTTDSIRRGGDDRVDPVLARLVLACWKNFFALFRHDELTMEFPRYRQEAEAVTAAIDALAPNEPPDLVTCKQILFLMSRFNRERFRDLSHRIEELSQHCRDLERQFEAHRLNSSLNEDELQRTATVLDHAAQRLQLVGGDGNQAAGLAEELARSLNRDRHLLRLVAEHLDHRSWGDLPMEVQQALRSLTDEPPDPADAFHR